MLVIMFSLRPWVLRNQLEEGRMPQALSTCRLCEKLGSAASLVAQRMPRIWLWGYANLIRSEVERSACRDVRERATRSGLTPELYPGQWHS